MVPSQPIHCCSFICLQKPELPLTEHFPYGGEVWKRFNTLFPPPTSQTTSLWEVRGLLDPSMSVVNDRTFRDIKEHVLFWTLQLSTFSHSSTTFSLKEYSCLLFRKFWSALNIAVASYRSSIQSILSVRFTTVRVIILTEMSWYPFQGPWKET